MGNVGLPTYPKSDPGRCIVIDAVPAPYTDPVPPRPDPDHRPSENRSFFRTTAEMERHGSFCCWHPPHITQVAVDRILRGIVRNFRAVWRLFLDDSELCRKCACNWAVHTENTLQARRREEECRYACMMKRRSIRAGRNYLRVRDRITTACARGRWYTIAGLCNSYDLWADRTSDDRGRRVCRASWQSLCMSEARPWGRDARRCKNITAAAEWLLLSDDFSITDANQIVPQLLYRVRRRARLGGFSIVGY